MAKCIRNTVFLIGIFILVTGGLFAQTPQELRFNTWVSGNLRENNDEHWYSVRATQAGMIIVETYGNTDTYLEAYDAYDNYLGEDDDGGEGLNARLEIFAQAGMTYTFVVYCYDYGPYEIRATQGPIPQATELRLDTDVSGYINEGQSYWYRVRATQNGYLTVETMGSTDTYLDAYDESYNLIDSNDDGGSGYNARLRLSVETGKNYLYRLRGYGNYESGPYSIWASYGSSAPTIAPTAAVVELRLDTMVSGNLRGGDEYWYSVRASQVGFLVVETSGNTDTYLEAYDASYNLINTNDDGGEGYNAKLEIMAAAGTTYLFKLRGYDRSESGSYRVWASSNPIPPATELRLDAIVNGNIREGESYWYSVRAAENGYITVGTTGSTDTYLEAYDSTYRVLGSDDDSGGGGNAELEIPVQSGQTYLFRLRGYSSSTSGPYRIWASFDRTSSSSGYDYR
jgi:hypothetical protein